MNGTESMEDDWRFGPECNARTVTLLLGGAIRNMPVPETTAFLDARHDPDTRHTLEERYGSETAVATHVRLRAIPISSLGGNMFDSLFCRIYRTPRGRVGRPRLPAAFTPEPTF